MYYVLTRNGSLFAVCLDSPYGYTLPDLNVHEMDGPIPDLNSYVWDADNDQFVLSTGVLTKLQFMNRFTTAERITVRSSTYPVVVDIMKMLDVAEYINTKDPLTVQAIGYLGAVGLLSASRVSEILA